MGTRLYIDAPGEVVEKLLNLRPGDYAAYEEFERKAKDFIEKGADSEFVSMFPRDPRCNWDFGQPIPTAEEYNKAWENGEEVHGPGVCQCSNAYWRVVLARKLHGTFDKLSSFETFGFGRLNQAHYDYIKTQKLGDEHAGCTDDIVHMDNLLAMVGHEGFSTSNISAYELDNVHWC